MPANFPPYVDITYFHRSARPDVDSLAQARINVKAIRQAIAWAGERGGGRILFPPGRWFINDTIELQKCQSIILQASGGAGVEDRGHPVTALVWSTQADPGGTVLRFMSCFRCGIRGLLIDGSEGVTPPGGTRFAGAGVGLEIDADTALYEGAKGSIFEDFRIIRIGKRPGNVDGVGLHVGYHQQRGGFWPDLADNTFRNFQIEGCDIGVLQEGIQTANNTYERGVIVWYRKYGMDFEGGDVTVSGIDFATSPTSVADVYVGWRAAWARFTNNYHETDSGTSYLFPLETDPSHNRPLPTLFTGVRVLYRRTGNIIDFQQRGCVTLIGCLFDCNAPNNPYVGTVNWNPPWGANPADIQEIGCIYLNGARSVFGTSKVAPLAAYGNSLCRNSLDPANPPLPYPYSTVADNPIGNSSLINSWLTLHNSSLVLQDTFAMPPVTLFQWKVLSDSGTLKIHTPQPRTSGTLLNLVNDSTPAFSVMHNGEVIGNSLSRSIQVLGTLTGATTISVDRGAYIKAILAANVALTLVNTTVTSATHVTLALSQDSIGGRQANWSHNVRFPGGTAPMLTATPNALDIFAFEWDGANYNLVSFSGDVR